MVSGKRAEYVSLSHQSSVTSHWSLVVVVETFPDGAGVVASGDEVAGYFLDSLEFGEFGFFFQSFLDNFLHRFAIFLRIDAFEGI